MVKLVETYNLMKAGRIRIAENPLLSFDEVHSIGDGNCGVYSLALGLIDLIKRNQLDLPKETFTEFYAKIKESIPLLKERVKLYRGEVSGLVGNAYTDLADPLQEIIELVETNPNFNFAQFKTYVSSKNDRVAIAAMQVALGPALRTIGVQLHQLQFVANTDPAVDIDDSITKDMSSLNEDSVDMGVELIDHLAHDFFKIHADIYDGEGSTVKRVGMTQDDDLSNDRPHVTLVHRPGHWNCLLSAEQRDGLACLPSLSNNSESDKLLLKDLETGRIKHDPNNWNQLVQQAEKQQTDTSIQNKVTYFFAEGKQIKVTKKLQEELDAELARKLQEEEYQHYCSRSRR